MATIINTPQGSRESGNNLGTIIGIILLLLIAYLFFIYGLPALRNQSNPEINIPNEFDVNINQSSPAN